MESSKNFWDCEIKSCGVTNNSNETSLAAISHRAICFSPFSKMKFSLMRNKWMEGMEISPQPPPPRHHANFFKLKLQQGNFLFNLSKSKLIMLFWLLLLEGYEVADFLGNCKGFQSKISTSFKGHSIFFIRTPSDDRNLNPQSFVRTLYTYIYVAVNFLSQVILDFFCFWVGWCMLMKIKQKEK